MVTGLSAAELEAGEDGTASRPLGPLLKGIGLFIAGFTVVFVALGAAASGLGRLLEAHQQTLTTAAGAVVVGAGGGAGGERAAGRGVDLAGAGAAGGPPVSPASAGSTSAPRCSAPGRPR